MNINQHNYEAILIDYLDGTLTEAECVEVELFLKQNPEIADQIGDFADVVLPSSADIRYDRKDELQIIAQSTEDFEKWEQNFPKLPAEHISYPHKTRLYKFGKRQIPQWSWVAAAACLAVAVLVVRPVFDTKNQSSDSLLSELKKPTNVNDFQSAIDEPIAEIDHREDVSHAPQSEIVSHAPSPKIASNPNKSVSNTSQRSAEALQPIEKVAASDPNEYLAESTVSAVSPIMEIPVSNELALLEKSESLFPSELEQADVLSTREKLEISANDYVLTPLRSTVHKVFRRFYERKNDVEMYLEQSKIPQFFAQR